ncbi:MAG: FtsX-like permease family protein [Romboutsia sp.]
MYSKIALGNVKKSFKDYSIYFLTLTLSVCIFYSFNSIESQKAIFDMSKSDSKNLEMLMSIISGLSVFVSFILGGLIVYANNFLIKKRKKELGIYMTLGMEKSKISKILVMETLIVGIISLLSGLILGLVLSQGLSIFTGKLFEVSMSEYKFIISFSAIGKTVMYFGIIFILVMILNSFIISKYKIIDLLTSSRNNENIKIKNSFIYVSIFIISVISLGIAYNLIIKTGLNINDIRFNISIILGILGTTLVFFSLAGFGLNLIQKSKNIYFKDLNIFILRQINSKVNTNFLSMSVICLMLFLTIGILSTGISFKNALQQGLENTTPFDASASMYINEDDNVKSIEESLNNIGFEFNNNEKYSYYTEYKTNDTLVNALEKYVNEDDKSNLFKYADSSVRVISLSDYNKLKELEGKKSISLNDKDILFTSNNKQIVKLMNSILEYNDKINLNNDKYTMINKTVSEEAMTTAGYSDNFFTLIVNDNFIKNSDVKIYASIMNVNFDENNREKSEDKFANLFKGFYDREFEYDKAGFLRGNTKEQVYSENKGMTTTVLFVGIYLGIVFLISSMAVLSLQQLSEASDSVERYKSLKRIGANEKMINRTIFIQTLIYFTLPLALAFIHSIVGIKVVNEFIVMFGQPNISTSSFMTAIIFAIVYIGYFYATYTGYKNIVKNS